MEVAVCFTMDSLGVVHDEPRERCRRQPHSSDNLSCSYRCGATLSTRSRILRGTLPAVSLRLTKQSWLQISHVPSYCYCYMLSSEFRLILQILPWKLVWTFECFLGICVLRSWKWKCALGMEMVRAHISIRCQQPS